MQTPSMIGAAMALRGVLESSDQPFEIHVIGTPSEESLDGRQKRDGRPRRV